MNAMTPAQIAIAHQLRGASWTAADLAASFHVTEAEFHAHCPFWKSGDEPRDDGLPGEAQFTQACFFLDLASRYAMAATSFAGVSSFSRHHAKAAIANLAAAARALGFHLVPINPQPTPERNG